MPPEESDVEVDEGNVFVSDKIDLNSFSFLVF